LKNDHPCAGASKNLQNCSLKYLDKRSMDHTHIITEKIAPPHEAPVSHRISKNVDYTLEKIVERGGKPKENILLKSSTFKKLCMMLNNKKAKEVREYFLKVEETLDKYKNYIINSLKTQVKKMDTSLKSHKKPSKGVIYGFEINDNNRKFIKIGKKENNNLIEEIRNSYFFPN
jgi:hypothetical protein